MVRQLVLLGILVSLTQAITVKIDGCACSEVLKESECDDYFDRQCEWNPETSKCVDPLPLDCPWLTQYGKDMCHNQYECAWYKDKCQDLGQCSDYTETVDDKCNNINANCITLDSGKCAKQKQPKCTDQTVESCSTDEDGQCVLFGDPKKCVSMDTCEKGSGDQSYCNMNKLSCVWVTNKCQQKTCSDITAQDQCRFVILYGTKNANLCHWVDNKCVDGEEDHYTETNCFSESAYAKVWNDGNCQECKGYGTVLSILVFLAMIIY